MSDHTVTAQVTQTICNALWGNQLSFHPFSRGDPPVVFSSLWPTSKQSLIDTYRDANIEEAPYELSKLLVATNSARSMDALLEERIMQVNQSFSPGCMTLAHLACAVGEGDIISVLARRSQANHGVWSLKDEEGHTPSDMCFRPEVKRLIPSKSIFGKKKVPQGLPLKAGDINRIFEMARNTDLFYQVIVQLQTYTFDVNRIRSKEGELLVHVAVKGGLPQLPLLFALVRQFKADVTLLDSLGQSPLCLACKRGEERMAEILICVFGVDINTATTSNGKTPLHWAVEHNNPAVVSMLLRRGADTNQEDLNKCVPSFVARRHRYLECRQIIVQFQMERVDRLAREATDGTLDVSRLYTSDSSIVTSSGCTLLMLATLNNHETVVRDLVKMEQCPLDFKQMKSCDLSDSEDSLTTSWKDMTPNSNYSLKTAVHMAAENGYTGCLQALIEAGAHPAIADASSWLPLHYACDNGHIDCVNVIVTYPNQLGLSGLRPALDITRGNSNEAISEVLEKAIQRRQTELVDPLLFEAAQSGNTEVLFAVLENGDNVNPTNEAHDWPLILAAGFGHLDLVQQLHEFGGHMTRKNKRTELTALHVAARGGHKEVVRYLLQFCQKADGSCPVSPFPTGANSEDQPAHLYINDRSSNGSTSLEFAVQQGHLDVVRLLLEHGASTTLPDSNGCELNCPSFAGTQFMMETHRKAKKQRILTCFRQKMSVKDLQKTWGGPSDFNLCKEHGDSLLMLAAQSARPEVLQFLLDEAAKCTRDMLISPGLPPRSNGLCSSSHEDSSPEFENSLPKNFKPQSIPNGFPRTALPTPRSHNPHGKNPEVTVTSLSPIHGAFPQTALPTVASLGPSPHVFSQTALPSSQGHKSHTPPVTTSTPHIFPQTALPSPKAPKGLSQAEATVTSLGAMHRKNNGGCRSDHEVVNSGRMNEGVKTGQRDGTKSDVCDGRGDRALLESRTALPMVVRTQVNNGRRQVLAERTGSARRKLPPKKPPRIRQRTQSDMPPRPVGLRGRSSGNATPLSDEDEQQQPSAVGVEPVANGYVGGASSEAESGLENKTKEFTKLLHFSNPADQCTALHRAAQAGRCDNICVLLKADEDLANMQDCQGNTALHLACLKAHKQAVKTLLSFKCVSTIVRNAAKELPEDRCMRRDVRKMVAKARQLLYGDNVPEWHGSPKQPRGMMASVGKAENGGHMASRLSEVVVDREEQFRTHFDKLKEEYDRSKTTLSTRP